MKKQLVREQIVPIIIVSLLCIAILYPFLMLVSASFSNEKDILMNGFKLIPEHFDLAAYKAVFKNPKSIIDAYKVTITFSVVGTVLALLIRSSAAYALSSPKLRQKNKFSFYFYFTMLFSGGLVPSYILITQYLHLDDTIWVYILPTLVSPWHIFMLRTFFNNLPSSLHESMRLDGASEYTIFTRLVLPLSKPAIATIALMTFLADWNNWNTAMLYINDQELISLQYLLQKIIRDVEFLRNNAQNVGGMDLSGAEVPTTTMQMAMAMIAAGPVLVIFPFFQKYFVKGLTVGSVKG